MNGKSVTPDRFAESLINLLGQIEPELEPLVEDAVNESVKVTRKVVTYGAKANFKTLNNKYKTGWRSNTKRRGKLTRGTVYQAKSPGLPHLLEKGHAKVGGGYVMGREHIGPAADVGFAMVQLKMGKAVDKVLESL